MDSFSNQSRWHAQLKLSDLIVTIFFMSALSLSGEVSAQIRSSSSSASATLTSTVTTTQKTALQEPRATVIPEPGCKCREISIICVDDIERRCGQQGAAACARPDLCVLFLSNSSKRCDTIRQQEAKQSVGAEQLSRILHEPGATATTLMSSTAQILTVSLTRYRELLGLIDRAPDANSLDVKDLADECLIRHETDHLCREVDLNDRCATEGPALDIQAACFEDAIKTHCKAPIGTDPIKLDFCRRACRGHMGQKLRAEFAKCFCSWRREGNTGSGVDACCDCHRACLRSQTLDECRPFPRDITEITDFNCTAVLNPVLAHSCGFFGRWAGVWGERIVRCDG